jgi:hypothetical protein
LLLIIVVYDVDVDGVDDVDDNGENVKAFKWLH